jgi:hypothetical protein
MTIFFSNLKLFFSNLASLQPRLSTVGGSTLITCMKLLSLILSQRVIKNISYLLLVDFLCTGVCKRLCTYSHITTPVLEAAKYMRQDLFPKSSFPLPKYFPPSQFALSFLGTMAGGGTAGTSAEFVSV